jgi:hypothetical protein
MKEIPPKTMYDILDFGNSKINAKPQAFFDDITMGKFHWLLEGKEIHS